MRGGAQVYYGSADATPLFVMLARRAAPLGPGRPPTSTPCSRPPTAALEWITTFGDRDGDGFVEYHRATDRGLRNQGWKDSFDGVNFADGRLADAPIALCEVQGYTYAALPGPSPLRATRPATRRCAARWASRAADLRAAFNERFWLPDRGWFAVGLDRDKRPIDALASNMGHCLWTGIIDEDKARGRRRAPHRPRPLLRLGRAHPRRRRWGPTTR